MAERLQDKANELFQAAEMGAFRAFPPDLLLPGILPWSIIADEIMPSNNAMALSNLRRLEELAKDKHCLDERSKLLHLPDKSPRMAQNSRASSPSCPGITRRDAENSCPREGIPRDVFPAWD